MTGNNLFSLTPFFLTYEYLTDRCSSCFLYISVVLLLLSVLRVSGPVPQSIIRIRLAELCLMVI